MNYRQKLGYTALGAIIMLIGLTIGTIVAPPLIAQNTGVFDTIECKSLTILDNNGQPAINLVSDPVRNIIAVHKPGETEPDITISSGVISNDIMFHGEHGEHGEHALSLSHIRADSSNQIMLSNPNGKIGITIASATQGNLMSFASRTGKPALLLYNLPNIRNGITISDNNDNHAVTVNSSVRYGNTVNVHDKHGAIIWEAPE